jgi:hypothetical protein
MFRKPPTKRKKRRPEASAVVNPTTIVIDLAASAIFFDAKYKPYGFCIESILSIQAFPAR